METKSEKKINRYRFQIANFNIFKTKQKKDYLKYAEGLRIRRIFQKDLREPNTNSRNECI